MAITDIEEAKKILNRKSNVEWVYRNLKEFGNCAISKATRDSLSQKRLKEIGTVVYIDSSDGYIATVMNYVEGGNK